MLLRSGLAHYYRSYLSLKARFTLRCMNSLEGYCTILLITCDLLCDLVMVFSHGCCIYHVLVNCTFAN